jgi:predicted esterase
MADNPHFVTFVLNPDDEDKPCVLVLHGCCQGTLLRGTIDIASYGKKLWHKLSKHYRVVFAFAPHVFVDAETGKERGKHWFAKQLEVDQIPVGIPYSEELTSTTLDRLHATIGTFDARVLIGFSQGSNVIDTYLAHHPDTHPVDCVVLFSGYGLTCDDRKEVDVPCMMVGCPEDDVVPWPPRFVSYETIETIEHDGTANNKHVMPKRASDFTKVVEFVVNNAATV